MELPCKIDCVAFLPPIPHIIAGLSHALATACGCVSLPCAFSPLEFVGHLLCCSAGGMPSMEAMQADVSNWMLYMPRM